ncbi:MAG: tetratricopeptide repeat protein [Armatimonadota bacterium]
MQCQKCNTINDEDSKFCKKCGQFLQLSTDDKSPKPDEHMRVGELIYAAYKHKEAGRIDDAILACQGALTLNDDNLQAHSLLGTLYEMKRNYDFAIIEYNRVLQVDPSNAGVQEKIDELMSAQEEPVRPTSEILTKIEFLRPYLPAAAAFASLCIVLIICSVLLKPKSNDTQGKPETTQASQPQAAVPANQYAQQNQQPPMYQQPQTYPTQDQIQNPQVSQPQVPAPAPAQYTAPANQSKVANRSSRQGIPSVPLPRTYQPTSIVPRNVMQLPPATVQPAASNYDSPVIVPVDNPSNEISVPSATVIRSNNAPSNYQAPRVATPADSPIKPVMDPEQKALQLQGSGKYQDAIGAYQSTVGKSNDKGRVYQQMGLSYQRLGKHQQAIQSYNSAIQSYKEQLSAGRDPAEVKRDIRACEAGIQVSQSQIK